MQLYIPLTCFMFGFPTLVFIILCLLQRRNRDLLVRTESDWLTTRRLSSSAFETFTEKKSSTRTKNDGADSNVLSI
ncbi:hypothetical protein AB6A40_007277 [Gnathostoma spinigerum]|uniref:ATP synthase F0 subunit 8 n=1 Tax=Gnathostoma spinigerum TaxID=75299 RepID=A0ABD6EL13_9BILA